MIGFIFFGEIAINPHYVIALIGLGADTTKIIMVNGEGITVDQSLRLVADRLVKVEPR